MTSYWKIAAVAAAGSLIAVGASAQGDTISKSAAVYGTYQADVTDVKTKRMSSAGDIDTALTNLGGQNADQLSKGWIAYSALIASQDPEYRAAVRDIESFYGRDVMLTGLKNDVRYARTLNGGSSAVGAALTATEADSRRLASAAASVKEQAYSLQGAGWAKAKIGNSKAKASSLNSAQMSGRPAASNIISALGGANADSALRGAGRSGAPSLWESVNRTASAVRVPSAVSSYGSTKRVRRGKEPIADQIATLAAYRVLGSQAANSTHVHTAMAQAETKNCLKMSQLNLQQCVAAAHQQYEVPFCIGEHALSDVGKCIGEVAQ